jgi:hypothetical protein
MMIIKKLIDDNNDEFNNNDYDDNNDEFNNDNEF